MLPLGVTSNFQFFEPHPVVMAKGQGSRLWDVDGNEYLDYNMGYGSLLAGHSHPLLVEAITRQASQGTLLVTPHPLATEVAEELCRRFPWTWSASPTRARNRPWTRWPARASNGRDMIIKLEGGYHGHHDLVMVSVKPPLDEAGPADMPTPVPYFAGIPKSTVAEWWSSRSTTWTRWSGRFRPTPSRSQPSSWSRCPRTWASSCRTTATWRSHRDLPPARRPLEFDEVKTGITSHPGGASGIWGVKPDLICLAKSIGGGLPVGAFGGRGDVMELITNWTVATKAPSTATRW